MSDVNMKELYVRKWDKYFMDIADVAANRSKEISIDEASGACIVNKINQVIGIGWYGMPLGRDELPWDQHHKHNYVIPAVCNAFFYRTQDDVTDCRVYTTVYPTNECAKIITQSGIKEVFYRKSKIMRQSEKVAETFLTEAKITMTKME